MKLSKSLLFIDLETTGLTKEARIVEISALKINVDGEQIQKTRKINPTIPIPPEATNVHKITDEDVALMPTFKSVSKSLIDFIGDSDLAGFNIVNFDIPILMCEFDRAGIVFSVENREILDLQHIFHNRHPRTLAEANKVYTGSELNDHHSAAADTVACLNIFLGMKKMYSLSDDIGEICKQECRRMVDPDGFFVIRNEKIIFRKGKHSGKSLQDVAKNDKSYINWLLNKADILQQTREVIAKTLS